MSISPVRVFIAAAFCVAAVASFRSVHAAEASAVAAPHDHEPFEFIYRFDSTDLQTSAGAQRVYRNLIQQAQRACSEDRPMHDLYRTDRHCAAALVNDVVVRIGSPVLAALQAKSPVANGLAASFGDRHLAGSP